MVSSLSLVLLVVVLTLVQATTIDNYLVEDPEIECKDTAITMSFRTRRVFTGRVYVKGMSEDSLCSHDFRKNDDSIAFTLRIANGDCNMKKERTLQPAEGITFSTVIMVSFHSVFVTKVDRAYRCVCFFRSKRLLTNSISVSALPTTEYTLPQESAPRCLYTIHHDRPAGPLVKFARIGQKLYHCWQCNNDHYGYLIRSCYVNDGRGNKFDLIDSEGCSTDPMIVPELVYEPQRACVETHGFKFSESSELNFQCVLELCEHTRGKCIGVTPPVCPSSNHRRNYKDSRSIRSFPDKLFLQSDSVPIDVSRSMEVFGGSLASTASNSDAFSGVFAEEFGETCYTEETLVITAIFVLLLLLLLTAIVVAVLLRVRVLSITLRRRDSMDQQSMMTGENNCISFWGSK